MLKGIFVFMTLAALAIGVACLVAVMVTLSGAIAEKVTELFH